jgi:Tfp pilus assembly protein PilX
MRRRLARLAGEERGFTLVLTLGVLIVTSAMIVSITEYSSSTSRSSSRSKADQIAFSLAETGVNNAMSILANPTNNALQQSTLPSAEASASSASYEGGTAKWWGVLNTATSRWTVYGKGIVANPTGPGSASVTRTLSATSQVVANYSQPLNATAWNYIYSTKTGDPDGCDMQLENSVVLTTPLYVMGNLCLKMTSVVEQGAEQPVSLVVKGGLVLDSSSNHVGTAAAPISSLQTVNGCKLANNAVHSPCTSADNVWATTIGTTPPPADPVAADFNYWYVNASLGPNAPCVTQTGTPPALLDPNGLRDGSLPSFELTPSSSYSCERGSALISWNAATKHLTVQGAIYIDGAVTISNNAVNTYSGQGSLYLSKGFTISLSSQLCGAVVSGNCDFNTWDPNQNLLMFVADGMAVTNSLLMQNSSRLQAGIFGTKLVELQNTAQLEGPIVASEILFQNSAQIHSFPPINTVPAGTPGNPNIYAEPQKPQNYSG